jgi:peptidoglycan/LPS O-acetylase OafA/YrhL
MDRKREPLLDFLRFLAAILVAVFHWGLELGVDRYAEIYELPIVGYVIANGGVSVDIFFIISGYVILATAQKHSGLEFIFARLNRIFPGLLFSMIIVLVVGQHFIRPYEKPLASFFHSTFLTYQVFEIEPLTTPLWTLIIEIKFYALVSATLLVFPNLFRSVKGTILFLASWEFSVFVLALLKSDIGPFLYQQITLDGAKNLFAIGMCLSLLGRSRHQNKAEILVVAMFTLYLVSREILIADQSINLKLILLFACILILVSPHVSLNRPLQKISYLLGLSSYLTYLLHMQLGTTFVLQFQSRISGNIFVIISLSMIAMTLTSIFLAIFVERPIQQIFRNLFSRIYIREVATT